MGSTNKIKLMNAAGEVTYADATNKTLMAVLRNAGYIDATAMARSIEESNKPQKDDLNSYPSTVGKSYSKGQGEQRDLRTGSEWRTLIPGVSDSGRVPGFSGADADRLINEGRGQVFEPKTWAGINPYKGEYVTKSADTYENIQGLRVPTPVNIDTVAVNPSFSGGQTASPVVRKQVVPQEVPMVPQEVPPVFLPKGLTPKTVPEESTYGFHKKDGQNFLTQNEKDPYWDDYVKGTGDGFSHAELKNKPKQEVDTQAIKNWLSSMFG